MMIKARMKRLLVLAGILVPISHQAFAQTPASTAAGQPHGAAAVDASVATPIGHELTVSVGSYTYTEPGPDISIHGPKFGGEYTGTLSLNRRQHWFTQANVRGSIGHATYDGSCAPWLIVPNSTSPNGYELDLGDFSPCGESGDADSYVEARGLVGKDFIGQTWAWSPLAGVGFRHLSNGTTGIAGYRTDTYLYLPLGMTARTRVASQRVLSFDVEYDHLIQGWQKTRDSELGGGFVPPTSTAPGFTIDSFTDISFAQGRGWALRASAEVQVTHSWSVKPYFIHWDVSDSPLNYETVAFTVNNVTAHEQLGAYEPHNVTNEFGVKLSLRF
jgi:hypothetical protein